MSDENNFTNVINLKIKKLNEAAETVQSNLANPQYHGERVRETIRSALDELSKLDESTHHAELISILNQMPQYVAAAWGEASAAKRSLGMQIEIWKDVQKEYEVICEQEQEPEPKLETPIIESDFLEAVRVGEIQEPSRRTAIRRKPGERPESLRKVRNAQAIIENSPEQK